MGDHLGFPGNMYVQGVAEMHLEENMLAIDIKQALHLKGKTFLLSPGIIRLLDINLRGRGSFVNIRLRSHQVDKTFFDKSFTLLILRGLRNGNSFATVLQGCHFLV